VRILNGASDGPAVSPRRALAALLASFRTGSVPGRRRFLQGAAAVWLAGMLGIGCRDEGVADGSEAARAPDPEALLPEDRYQRLLALVAGAVLPSKLGESEQQRIAAEFSAWLEDYDPSTEPAQYATYDYTPNAGLTPYPRERIEADLREIESASLREFSRPFEELGLAERQALLRERIAEHPAEAIGGWIFRPDGHVALSLLDFYYHFRRVHRSRRRK
jgi:hypothetical protein